MTLALNCLDFGKALTFREPASYLHIMFFFYDVHIWTVVMIKTSLAFMLLRFHQERAWRLSLYTLIAIQATIACASTLTNYLRCTPLRRAWDEEIMDGKCISEQRMKRWMWVICGRSLLLKYRIQKPNILLIASAFSIVTDALYTIIPLTDILRLDRSLRERLALCLLMSISLLATAASIIKTSVISYAYNDFGDTHSLSDLMLCSLLELFLGIMGACLPCLKQRFQRALHWTKRRTICFWGERVDCGDSIEEGGPGRSKRNENTVEERDFGCTLGLGDSSSGGSENDNYIPLPAVPQEAGVIVLDGYTPDKEGQWRWSTSEAFEVPRLSQQNSTDERCGDYVERIEDDARRTIDLMIQVPEAVVLYGVSDDDGGSGSWATRGLDAFQGARYVPDGVRDATQHVRHIIKTTKIEVVEEAKPVGWEEMEVGFGIKRIWAERGRHGRS
jgi:hypothetical protein